MKNQIIGLIGLILGAAALSMNLLKPVPKIGYVETAALMSQFSEAIKAQKEMDKSREEWNKNLKLINDSLMASMTAMKQKYEGSSPKERDELRKNMEKWNSDLNRYTQAVKRMSEEKDRTVMEPVISKVNGFLKQWGKQNGYSMIFGTTNDGNLMQAEDAYNLTSRVLVDLNAHYLDLPVRGTDSAVGKPQPKSGEK